MLEIGERTRFAEPREIVAMRVKPNARRTDAACDEAARVGRTMRTAMSASPRARSWLRLVTASSTATPDCGREKKRKSAAAPPSP